MHHKYIYKITNPGLHEYIEINKTHLIRSNLGLM